MAVSQELAAKSQQLMANSQTNFNNRIGVVRIEERRRAVSE